MASVALYVAVPVALLVLIRKYREYTWGTYKSKSSLKGRVFLITGANSGVGKETASQLAARDATVIMASRNMEATNLAIKDIRNSTQAGKLIPMQLDLASFESIRNFAKEVLKEYPEIHVLINNAGIYFPPNVKDKTAEGFEMHIGVNHLGHFLLTDLLMDRIKSSAPSRIVIVSSRLHERGVLDVNDLNMETRQEETSHAGSRISSGYCASKLANVYHARELAHQLKGTGVDVYALCPSFTYTNLFRYNNVKWWQYFLFAPIAFFYMRSAWQGSQTIVMCATEEKMPGESGDFFTNCQRYQSTMNFDPRLQLDLWMKSSKIIGK